MSLGSRVRPPAGRQFPSRFAMVCSSASRYYEGSDSCLPSLRAAGLPACLATPSRHSASNHAVCPGNVLHASYNVPDVFRTSPRMSRLAVTPRRIEFALLRTASSLPVALHPASQRRSYLRLRGLGLPRHGLPPCRCSAFTGALIPAKAGIQLKEKVSAMRRQHLKSMLNKSAGFPPDRRSVYPEPVIGRE